LILPFIDLKNGRLIPESTRPTGGPAAEDSGPVDRRHIAFLIRKNFSSIGGVQSLNSRLYEVLSPIYDIEKISYDGPEWGVPFYFPAFYQRAARNGASLVYCDDAVTALIGSRIRAKTGKTVVAGVHGLDIVLPVPWYQKRLRRALANIDKIICISRATAEQVRLRGGRSEQIEVIPGAVEKKIRRFPKDDSLYNHLASILGVDLRGKKVLVSVGRPVKRKGFDRFATEVFPRLPQDHIYIVIGPKPSTPIWIKSLAPILGSELYRNLLLASGSYTIHDELVKLSRDRDRIFYINGVSQELRDMFLSAGDLFIMPNRTVDGDMEGFGLVALEAASRGLPVIATAIEGIVDAVCDGLNGYCVPESDHRAMARLIIELTGSPERLHELSLRAGEYTRSTFSQEKLIVRFRQIFDNLLTSSGRSA
jgi:phosphatidylinositol alpha-1,6-mannosyltransferase